MESPSQTCSGATISNASITPFSERLKVATCRPLSRYQAETAATTARPSSKDATSMCGKA